MSIGVIQFLLIFFLFSPPVIALILCLTLIKNKPYKKLSSKQIYAGFWVRLIAGIIDFIVLWVIYLILMIIPIIGWIFSLFVSWLYFAIQQSSSKQATLGMRALDIKITDEKHGKISFWRASGNYFVVYFSGLLIFIGFLMIAFTSRKQGLHNIISRTLCIRAK
tara:strand:- start:215 stop:706 length:492 start_codon:yes stop_codon:yes gene_type:complete